MGGRSMNRCLDLGMITNHRLSTSHWIKVLEPSASHRQVLFMSPQILFSTLIGSNKHNIDRGDDEDISSIDTTTHAAQQGPMTRA
jgi:hypothetical protein